MNVLAIWTTKTGCSCPKCRTERDEYHATIRDGGGERMVYIDARAYSDLSDRAGANDYQDGGYIAFDQPIEWGDVFAEDRVA